MFEIDEETQQTKMTEEFPAGTTETLKSLESWAHSPPIILQAGRCTHAEPVGMGDEEKEEYMGKLAESDKVAERFMSINEDVAFPGVKASWTSKVCGDSQLYKKAGGEDNISYAVNVIKSLRWPGAVTVAKGGQYCNIYIGDSMKRGDNNMSMPPDVFTKDPVGANE
jgi:hypothetical protein